jgi:hypothetical protein
MVELVFKHGHDTNATVLALADLGRKSATRDVSDPRASPCGFRY